MQRPWLEGKIFHIQMQMSPVSHWAIRVLGGKRCHVNFSWTLLDFEEEIEILRIIYLFTVEFAFSSEFWANLDELRMNGEFFYFTYMYLDYK